MRSVFSVRKENWEKDGIFGDLGDIEIEKSEIHDYIDGHGLHIQSLNPVSFQNYGCNYSIAAKYSYST